MKILLIESEQEHYSIQAELRDQFRFELAKSAGEGEYLAETGEFSLIIIHSELSDKKGIELCKLLRNKDIHTPILILSSSKDINEKISTIDAGADDFLTKPLHSSLELHTHVRALTRRTFTKQEPKVLTVNDLTMDTYNKMVKRGNKILQLRRKEYDILEYFMRNPGRIITREMILNHVWTNVYESFTNTIDVHIKYLRDQVDKPFNKKLIKTVYGFGYKIQG